MTQAPPSFGAHDLDIDPAETVEHISAALRGYLAETRRRGVVVAMSGGIDSSVVAAVCVAALGPEHVFGLHLPERESSGESLELSGLLARTLGIESEREDITPVLEAAGCYSRRDDAIRTVCPEYGEGYSSKIVLPSVVDSDSFRLYSLVVRDPEGTVTSYRLTPTAYLGIVAATNFKQRVRKMTEYYHADRLNYAVAGTPNRLEYDQGFFVKLGDGAADVKPIAHLYKTQVYELAEHLGVPEQIRSRPPTTDTYSMPQSQEEFYFSLPYGLMDLCLFGVDHGIGAEEVAAATGLTPLQVERVFRDIEQKRRTTRYLHLPPRLVEEVPGDDGVDPAARAKADPLASGSPTRSLEAPPHPSEQRSFDETRTGGRHGASVEEQRSEGDSRGYSR
jgi:NAD+ synthase